jgi:tetratricopeptide (TPR) repeat protein
MTLACPLLLHSCPAGRTVRTGTGRKDAITLGATSGSAAATHSPEDDRAAANGGDVMSGQLDYEINKELGECYLFMGDLDKAEEYYAKAVTCNGVHADPYLGLATVAVQRGDLDKAMGLYRKASSIEANDKSLAGMALIELERGETAEAFTHFRGALASNPENVVALYGLVRLGHAQERLEEVLPYLFDYLALDPLKHEVRYTLAGCLVSLGRLAEASTELENILAQDPRYAAAQELAEELKRVAA